MERRNTGETSVAGYAPAQETAAPEAHADAGANPDLADLQRRIEVLEELLAGRSPDERPARPQLQFEPDLDVFENDREFLIHAAVPGAEPGHIHVEATPHTVTLTADIVRSPDREAPDGASPTGRRHRRSRHADHDRYHVVYTLHSEVLPDAARATVRNGIVEIHLVKAQSAQAFVPVPVSLFDDSHGSASRSDAAGRRSADSAAPSAREGSPRHKMGAAYASNPGEDHTSKAVSVGEQIAPGRMPARADQVRTIDAAPAGSAANGPAAHK